MRTFQNTRGLGACVRVRPCGIEEHCGIKEHCRVKEPRGIEGHCGIELSSLVKCALARALTWAGPGPGQGRVRAGPGPGQGRARAGPGQGRARAGLAGPAILS